MQTESVENLIEPSSRIDRGLSSRKIIAGRKVFLDYGLEERADSLRNLIMENGGEAVLFRGEADICLDELPYCGMYYLMATMTHRTSFALDERTAQRIKRLATRWNVSQAEVVRRSVERTDEAEAAAKTDPIEMLKQLHARGGGIDKVRADQWIKEIYEDRKRWRASS